MINSTTILRYIEKKLGYKFEDLELDMNDIIRNIQEDTLETFSHYFPLEVTHIVNCSEDLVEGYNNRYYLKLDFDTTINSVKKIFISNSIYGQLTDNMFYYTNMRSFLDGQLTRDIMSMFTTPVTFDFDPSDETITIMPEGYKNDAFSCKLNCVHFKDFSTIPNALRQEFLSLTEYDTKIALLPLRRRFSNLNTPYGNIELFISDLEEANDKRDALLEKWRANYYKSPKRKKIYIY